VWSSDGAIVSGVTTGWHVYASRSAERHGPVIIIALGEAFISIGIGARGTDLGLGEVAAAVLGILVATSFWLAYFDFFSIRGERILGDLERGAGDVRPRRVHVLEHPEHHPAPLRQ
jgi:low temperature requirement protein LtrA